MRWSNLLSCLVASPRCGQNRFFRGGEKEGARQDEEIAEVGGVGEGEADRLQEKIAGDEGEEGQGEESYLAGGCDYFPDVAAEVDEEGEEGAGVAEEVEVEEVFPVADAEEALEQAEVGG